MVAGQGKELKIYQEFTADPAEMLAAISSGRIGSQIRNAGRTRSRQNLAKLKQAEDECNPCSYDLLQITVQRAAALFARTIRMRTLRSLDSLRAIVAYLHSGTGRSDLFYFTDGFATDPGRVLRRSRRADLKSGNPQPLPGGQRGPGDHLSDQHPGRPLPAGPSWRSGTVPNRDWNSLIESKASDTLAAFRHRHGWRGDPPEEQFRARVGASRGSDARRVPDRLRPGRESRRPGTIPPRSSAAQGR